MNPRTLPWALAALYLLFLFPTPEFPPYNADDGSWFTVMAWNLAQYGRYTSDTYPLAVYGHHASWPPLFATVLAAVIKLFGLNWLALKAVMAVFGLAALAMLQKLWRDDAAGGWAVLLTALSPAFFLYSHHTMTEAPYILVVAAALWGLARAEDGRAAFLAGLLAVLAFFTRGYAAIFLPAGLLFFLLRPWPWRRRFIACAAFAAPLVAAILAWKGYTGHIIASQPLDWISTRFGNGAGMLNDLLRSPKEYLQRLYWFDLRYPAHFMLPLLPLPWAMKSDLSVLLSLLLLGLAGLGWWRLFRSRRGAVECWLPLALAFMFVSRSGAARYWLPFLPFLYYYLLHGLGVVGERLPTLADKLRLLPYALLLVAAAALGMHLANPDRLRFATPASQDYRDVALWAGEHLPADAVVIAPAPSHFLAASGRASWSVESPLEPLHGSGRPVYLLCSPDTPKALCAGAKPPLYRLREHALVPYPL